MLLTRIANGQKGVNNPPVDLNSLSLELPINLLLWLLLFQWETRQHLTCESPHTNTKKPTNENRRSRKNVLIFWLLHIWFLIEPSGTSSRWERERCRLTRPFVMDPSVRLSNPPSMQSLTYAARPRPHATITATGASQWPSSVVRHGNHAVVWFFCCCHSCTCFACILATEQTTNTIHNMDAMIILAQLFQMSKYS